MSRFAMALALVLGLMARGVAAEQPTAAALPDYGRPDMALEERALIESDDPGTLLLASLKVFANQTLGAKDAAAVPVLYAFLDPDCPHCHQLLQALDALYLSQKTLQLRVLPLGYVSDTSKRKAAWIQAQKDGADKLLANAKDPEKTSIPAPKDLDLTDQEYLRALFDMWLFDGTPILVYQDKNKITKIVRGLPKDLKAMVDEMAIGEPRYD